MLPRPYILLILMLWLAPGTAAPLFSSVGRVVHVRDGDTLTLQTAVGVFTLELADIDAPEIDQPWGRAARKALGNRVINREVRVQGTRRGHTLHGYLFIDGEPVNVTLVDAGLAWLLPEARLKAPIAGAYLRARQARRGLWGDPEPVDPAAWRAGSR